MKTNYTPRFAAFLVLGAITFLALGFTLGKKAGEITPATIEAASELFGLSFPRQKKTV